MTGLPEPESSPYGTEGPKRYRWRAMLACLEAGEAVNVGLVILIGGAEHTMASPAHSADAVVTVLTEVRPEDRLPGATGAI